MCINLGEEQMAKKNEPCFYKANLLACILMGPADATVFNFGNNSCFSYSRGMHVPLCAQLTLTNALVFRGRTSWCPHLYRIYSDGHQ